MHFVGHELHGVHVARKNSHVHAVLAFGGNFGNRGNHVVRLKTRCFVNRETELGEHAFQNGNLGIQLVRLFHPRGFVRIVGVMPKGLSGLIKCYGHPHRFTGINHLKEEGQKAVHRVHHRSVLRGERRQSVPSPVQQGVSINHQELIVPFCHIARMVTDGQK